MAYAAETDPLCYPGTTVLRNLLDIEDAELLDEAELALFLLRAEKPFPLGNFDVEHYLALHRYLFQDVYFWAGEIRTIRIGKAATGFAILNTSPRNWNVSSLSLVIPTSWRR